MFNTKGIFCDFMAFLIFFWSSVGFWGYFFQDFGVFGPVYVNGKDKDVSIFLNLICMIYSKKLLE